MKSSHRLAAAMSIPADSEWQQVLTRVSLAMLLLLLLLQLLCCCAVATATQAPRQAQHGFAGGRGQSDNSPDATHAYTPMTLVADAAVAIVSR